MREPLRNETLAARAAMRQALATAEQSGLAPLFSLRYDFPTEWSAFVKGTGPLGVQLRKDHFPCTVDNEDPAIDALELYARDGTELTKRTITPIPTDLADELNGTNRASDLSIPLDPDVLKPATDAQGFLILRYRLEE